MKINPVLRFAARFLVPVIMLFALYVQFHGDYGPGGGFQAGVIFAAAFVLFGMVFGYDAVIDLVPDWLLKLGIAGGVFLYAGVGVVTMMLGGGYLGYDTLGATPTAGQHLGVFLVELGVGVTVASVMIAVFLAFAGRRNGTSADASDS